jgi:hypothetical protein
MIIYFLQEKSGFFLILGMYLLPILLLYGVPSSILSDFVTKKLNGVIRGTLALLIHLFLATLFILLPILYEWERVILFTDIKKFLDNYYFFLMTTTISSSIFWCLDEFFRWKWNKILEKIGDFKIY